MDKFKQRVVHYVNTTDKIKAIQADIKKLRQKIKPYEERKRKLSQHILTFMNANKQNSTGIKYKEVKLTPTTAKRTQSISKDYLTKSITAYFNGDKKKADHLLDHIYNNRQVTTTQILRQTAIKPPKHPKPPKLPKQ